MRYSNSSQSYSKGITLAEILVVVAICTITLCLLMPALIRARSESRMSVCQQKLGRLVLSVHEFESGAGSFPSGVMDPSGPIKSLPDGIHHSWLVLLVPFLEGAPDFSQLDFSTSVYDKTHRQVRRAPFPAVVCPAASEISLVGDIAVSDYAACHHDREASIAADNRGVFFLNSKISRNDVVDGLAFTLFVAEKRQLVGSQDLGWMSGTRATLRNTGSPLSQTYRNTGTGKDDESSGVDPFYVGGFGSWHPRIAHLGLGDGRVAPTSIQIDLVVYQQLGNRQDGVQLHSPSGESEAQRRRGPLHETHSRPFFVEQPSPLDKRPTGG